MGGQLELMKNPILYIYINEYSRLSVRFIYKPYEGCHLNLIVLALIYPVQA
jgi:hypothetical protein